MIGPYLVDTITLVQYKGKDKWGEPLASTSLSVKARVDYKDRVTINIAGEEIVSAAKVTVRPRTIIFADFATRASNTISYEDKVVVDGVSREIVAIGKQADFSVRYLEVYVK
jgi:hypothetical protein